MHPNAQIVLEPGSRRVEVGVMGGFQIEDGQIIASRDHFDMEHLTRQ